MTLERSNIAAMQGYAPGEQPQDLTTIKPVSYTHLTLPTTPYV